MFTAPGNHIIHRRNKKITRSLQHTLENYANNVILGNHITKWGGILSGLSQFKVEKRTYFM